MKHSSSMAVPHGKNAGVHHIYERDERPDLIYDIDNLITVSRDSHAEIHEWYAKDKRAAIARIKKGIQIFREMYGDDD